MKKANLFAQNGVFDLLHSATTAHSFRRSRRIWVPCFEGTARPFCLRYETSASIRVFADPPFDLGKEYGKHVNDSLGESEYLEWCRVWIDSCIRVLKPGGSFFIYNLPRWNIELGHHLNARGLVFRHWIAVNIKAFYQFRGGSTRRTTV